MLSYGLTLRGIAISLCIILVSNGPLFSQTIFTFAGSGSNAYSGDGAAATAAGIPYPKDICTDRAGNILITCYNNVRKINPFTGVITTIAGTGNAGYSGDGGPATQAEMRFPWGITTDTTGNIYIAEYASGRIRKIDGLSGKIYTVAGTGYPGYNGDGILAVNAHLNSPQGIAVDNKGNIYFTDGHNYRVRKIDVATGLISTIAGNGISAYAGDGGLATAASIAFPTDVIIDRDGNLLISEAGTISCRIRKVNLSTGIITTHTGNGLRAHSGDGGLGINASLFEPTSLTLDAAGALYISQYVDARVRKIDPVTNIITTLAGTGVAGFSGDCGPAKDAQLNFPEGLIFDRSGTLYVVDNTNHRIRKIVPDGSPSNTSVVVTATDTLICAGTNVTFTANPINTGGNLIYQWKVNNNLVGTNSKTFSSANLKNNDSVSCILTVFSTCGNIFYVSSKPVIIRTTSAAASQIQLTASGNDICQGVPITFTAQSIGAGANPVYQWQLNGNNIGSNSSAFTTDKLRNNDKVACFITSQQSGCAAPITIGSDTMVMIIKELPLVTMVKDSFLINPGESIPLQVSIAGPVSSFEWQPATAVINSSSLITQSVPIYNDTKINFRITGLNNCSLQKPVIVKMMRGLGIPNAFTPNGDGKNDVFRISTSNSITLKEFIVFDRWGTRIFTTKDPSVGWDGTFKGKASPAGAYAYNISGIGPQGEFAFRGMVVLVR